MLLLKLFYQNSDNAAKVLHLYKGQKSLCKGPITQCALWRSQTSKTCNTRHFELHSDYEDDNHVLHIYTYMCVCVCASESVYSY